MNCCNPCPPCYQPICVQRTRPIKPSINTYVPSDAPFEGLTVYRENYFPKCTDKAQSLKPSSTFAPSCAPLDGVSTYREAYNCKPYSKRDKFVVDTGRFDPSCAPMEGLSVYRDAFRPFCSEKVPSMKPASTFEPSCGVIEGISTYRGSFVPYGGRECAYAKQTAFKPKMEPFSPSCAPMEGLSMYRSEFFCKPSEKTPSFKPQIRAKFSDAPFADRSTYRNDFPAFTFDCDPCMACPPSGPSGGQMNGKQYFCHDPCPPPEYVQMDSCKTVGSCGDC